MSTSSHALPDHANRILNALESINDLGVGVVEPLSRVYDDEMVFQDSIHPPTRGKRAYLDMCCRFAQRGRSFRYTIDRQRAAHSGDNLFFPWVWEFTGKVGPTVRVSGLTHLQLRNQLVVYQRDYYDVAGSVLDVIPAAGAAYRAFMRFIG